MDVWLHFLNHNHIKDNPHFKLFIPQILAGCRKKFRKVRERGGSREGERRLGRNRDSERLEMQGEGNKGGRGGKLRRG